MTIRLHKHFATTVIVFGLMGCAGLPLGRLQPPSSSSPVTCSAVQNIVDIAAGAPAPAAPGGPPSLRQFTFVLPNGGALGLRGLPGGAPVVQNIATFDDFVSTAKSRLSYLPPKVQNHDVTDAILRIMVKTSAQAQLDRAKMPAVPGAAPIIGINEQQAAVNAFSVPAKLTLSQLKDFADKFTDQDLQPNIIPPAPGAAINPFGTYFTDYYEGKFTDRFGQSVSKPTFSLTVPDAEIAAALIVLVEYTVDLIDPTPVLGDKDPDPTTHQFPTGTTFYPGGKKNPNEPTALTSGLAKYKNIAANTCGVTTANTAVLADVANAAGDRAATISGLVAQSWGGISIGLGVLGKLSIGDNQTLGTIVKTAATRLGSRISYAAAYWALDSVGQSQAPGAAPTAPLPREYLQFP